MKYFYTATFSPMNGKIVARVPDLPGCVTTGKDLSEAMDLIEDAAGGWLVVAEDNNYPIPEASDQALIEMEPDAKMSMLRIDTIAYRAATDIRAVRKNVSIPAWMDNLATKRGINCSKLLQESLRSVFES